MKGGEESSPILGATSRLRHAAKTVRWKKILQLQVSNEAQEGYHLKEIVVSRNIFAILLLWIADNNYHGNDQNMVITIVDLIHRNDDNDSDYNNDHNDHGNYSYIQRSGYEYRGDGNSTWLSSLEIKTKPKAIDKSNCS